MGACRQRTAKCVWWLDEGVSNQESRFTPLSKLLKQRVTLYD